MTVKQTRCPFCHSAFYITSLQLNAYRGQARCGQCHQIFEAAAHMVGSAPAPKPLHVAASPEQEVVAPKPVATPVDSEQASPVSITEAKIDSSEIGTPEVNASVPVTAIIAEEQLLFSDDGVFNDINLVEQAATSSPDPLASVTATNAAVNTQPTPMSSTSNISPNEDDALLFSDDVGYPNDDPIVASSNNSSSIVLDGTFNQQFLDDTYQEIDILGQHELSGVEKLHKAADESWLEDLLAEEDVPEIVEELKIDPGSNKRPANINSSAAQISEALAQRAVPDHDEDLLSFLNRTGAVTVPSSKTEKPTYSPNARPASHRILKPTTIKSSPAHFVGWGLMSLLMLGLLVSQYLYFNFETMAMNPKTSGYMTKMCALVGCQIPYMNADEILVKNIHLLSNKKLGQTTFKAKITNTAKLSQPFPALQLTLQQNGKTVARQIIQPRQYLPTELKTLARLASKNLYPIEFTINTKRSDIQDFEIKAQYY